MSRRFTNALLIAIVAWFGVHTASAQTPPKSTPPQPLLQLNTGGHLSTILSLGYTRDGFLLSGGKDKVVHVWDTGTQRIARSLRGHFSNGREGTIDSIAVQPTGPIVAVAGNMAPTHPTDYRIVCGGEGCGDIRLFNRDTGEVIGHLRGHSDTVRSVAFSNDGKLLASAGARKDSVGASKGPTVRLWDMVKLEQRFAVTVPGERVSQLLFTPDQKHLLLASGPDVFREGGLDVIRVLDVQSGQIVKELMGAKGRLLSQVAINDSGNLIAAAGLDSNIYLWRWPSGEPLEPLLGDGAEISGLAFGHRATADVLVSTPALQRPGTDKYISRVWKVSERKVVREFDGHDNLVSALAFAPDGEEVATAGGSDVSIQLWKPLLAEKPYTLVGRGRIVWRVGFAHEIMPAGPTTGATAGRTYVLWGYKDPCPAEASCAEAPGEFQYALRLPQDGVPETRPVEWPLAVEPGQTPARFDVRGSQFDSPLGRLKRHGSGGRFPELSLERDGASIAKFTRNSSARGGDHVSYSLDPFPQRIASGGRNGAVDLLHTTMKPVSSTPLEGHTDDVWSVAFDRQGRYLITGSGDQTVRLWNAETGEPIVGLLHTVDNALVIWTPQGYFAASPGADKLLGWQVSNGREKAAEFVTGAQVGSHFRRPTLIARALELASAQDAVTEADKAGQLTKFRLEDFATIRPPALRLDGGPVLKGRMTLKVSLPPSSAEIVDYRVIVNGDQRAPKEVNRKSFKEVELAGVVFDLALSGGTNRITVTATNVHGLSGSAGIEVPVAGEGAQDYRDTLYVVAVGVDHYPNLSGCNGRPDCNLGHAANDAKSFLTTAEATMVGLGKGHRRIEKQLLVTGGQDTPSRANIENALKLFNKATSNDTVILFVAGHGDTAGSGDYHFLPTEARRDAAGRLANDSVINWKVFDRSLKDAAGRKLMFVDTCFSRSAYSYDTLSDADAVRAVIYTAAGSSELAIETRKGGHFTSAVVDGLRGKADPQKKREVRVQMLNTYITDTVQAQSGGAQRPHSNYHSDMEDFVLTRH